MPDRPHAVVRVALALFLAALVSGCGDGTGPEGPEITPRGPVVDGVRLRILAEDLYHPVAIAIPGDGSRIFIAGRTGPIHVIRDGLLLPQPFLDLTGQVTQTNFEQGLLGLALHPDYEENGYFYINFTDLDHNTRVARYRVSSDPDRADPASGTLILEVEQPGPRHNGGNLLFGPDGMLYIGMGDGDSPENAQNLESLLGKLLRIDVDGGSPYASPPDNPFVGVEGRDEIWAYGLRNPWRYSFDLVDGTLWLGDVGEAMFEEVNRVGADDAGLNYGWPSFEGFECVAAEGCPDGTVEPVLAYDHTVGCAVIGGHIYRGDALPELQGHYFYADNCHTWLRSFDPSDPETVRTWDFGETVGSIFSFGVDPAGELYVLTIDAAYRLEPAE